MEEPPSYIAPRKRRRWREMVRVGQNIGMSIEEARAAATYLLAPRRLILRGETVVGRVKSLKAWGIGN
jgi:hypothetical protein